LQREQIVPREIWRIDLEYYLKYSPLGQISMLINARIPISMSIGQIQRCLIISMHVTTITSLLNPTMFPRFFKVIQSTMYINFIGFFS